MSSENPGKNSGGTSKKQKVFNLGFSKTGTTTFDHAMKALGYKPAFAHWKRNFVYYLCALSIAKEYDEIIQFTNYYDSFADAPWGGDRHLYKILLKRLPNSKFILTKREPEAWYNSFEKQMMIFDRNPKTAMSTLHASGMWGTAYFFRNTFNIKELSGKKEHIIDCYNRHNNNVVEHFYKRGVDLLVWDITEEPHWDKLCRFLAVESVSKPFPHKNKTPNSWEAKREKVIRRVNKELILGIK